MHKLANEIRSTCDENGVALLDIRRGLIFRVNPVGAFILKSLRQGDAENKIATAIADQYSISEDVAVADVREFIHSLAQHKLLEPGRKETLP